MLTTRLKELEALRSNITRLESEVATEINQELAALPSRFGFATAAEFIAAVSAASGVTAPRRGRPPGRRSASLPPKRKRAVITDAHRAAVKKLVQAGRSGSAIAKEVGISLPSVQNIKKALGLVKERR